MSVAERLERYRVRLFGYAFSLTGDREEADDLFQECALRALAAKSVPDNEHACRAWLFRVLRNAWIDRTRRRRTAGAVLYDEETREPKEDTQWDFDRSLIDTIAIQQAMQKLSINYREIISLVDLAGFSYAEVAELLEIPTGTVMSRLSRARKALLSQISSAQSCK